MLTQCQKSGIIQLLTDMMSIITGTSYKRSEYNERKDAVELLRLFSREQGGEPIEEQLEDMAASGKVSYGETMDDRKADPEAAVKNAVQCFEDGMVALFADGVRYTKKDEPIPLKDQSEVTFVRLVFLAGRMW